jgi:glutathione S-transferase
MREMENQIPQWGAANKPRVLEFLALLDREFGDRADATGEDFRVADITGLAAIDFMKAAKQLPQQFTDVRRRHAQIASRLSARV